MKKIIFTGSLPTPLAFTFDIIMLDLNEKPYDIHKINIRASEKLSGNLIKAPKLDVKSALKKYGKEASHHLTIFQ